MLNFDEIKRIKLTDVVARYKIALRFKGEYAAANCPLPTHKEGDKGKSFSINLAGNYWRCFSESCNANNGGKKGGDVINFVALMEGCREKEAAQKLADWYGIDQTTAPATTQTKAPTHMERGPKENIPAKDSKESSSSSGSVKYMQEVEAWFHTLIVRGDQEEDVAYWDRILKGIKSKLVESYRSGQKTKAA